MSASMTLLRGLHVCICAPLVAAAAVRAGEPGLLGMDGFGFRAEPRQRERALEIRGKLASVDLAQRAGGAWEAAEANLRELGPEIVAAARRTISEARSAERELALRAELDALIRLDSRPLPEELGALAAEPLLWTHVLVLAARDPARHAATLEKLRPDLRLEERIAADNLLAAGAPARAVALLLPEARVRIVVKVVEPGSGSDGGGQFSCGTGCGTMRVPAGFPPTALYDLRLGAQEEGRIIADGPEPVSVVRLVRLEREFGFGHSSVAIDTSDHALRLLRWIALDRERESPLTARVVVRHIWRDRSTFLRAVEREIQAREQAWNALVERLVNAELMVGEQAPSRPPIEVAVEDRRLVRRAPLPWIGR